VTAPPGVSGPDTLSSKIPFHGWRIVAFASIATAMTAPGQTAAISAFVDPIIGDLGVSRSAVSTAYLVGTLAGATALPLVGSLIDRYGVRVCMAVIGAVFGGVLIALAFATELFGLTAGFVGIRLAGQGALGLAATTVTAHWFTRRRGVALGIVSGVGAAGISLTPLLLERLIAHEGWRTAWLVEGLVVWAIVVPIAMFGIRNRPEDIGQHSDGLIPSDTATHHSAVHLTRARAVQTGSFWVLSASVATVGLLGTAVGFHQIDLLGERGLSPAQAAANFLPQTVAGILATVAAGAIVDRWPPKLMIVASMAVLAAALVGATAIHPGWTALLFGLAIGASNSAIRTVEAALAPRLFGTRHLGSIRGLLTAISVGSTAFGPVLFAIVHDRTGGYDTALLCGAVVPVMVGAAALMVRTDAPPSH
jgi:MFS family permease